MFDFFKKIFADKSTAKKLLFSLGFALFSAIYTAVCIIAAPYMPLKTGKFAVAAAVLLLAVAVAAALIWRTIQINRARIAGDTQSDMLGSITLDFMVELKSPVLICDDNGKIVWYNPALASFMVSSGAKEDLHGKSISHILGVGLESMRADHTNEGLETAVRGMVWRIKPYRFESDSKGKYLNVLVWTDTTELSKTRAEMANSNTVIAYIVMDNLEEISQFSRSSDHILDAAIDIRQILYEWARSCGGVIREFSVNKFIFFFTADKLHEFTADRFGILDRIRNIRVGSDISLPITVSIGVGSLEGSLSEKEQSAQSALDTALQRGGDQVVVKTEAGIEFYGGRTRGVQKRTKVRARVVANKLAGLISSSSNVLIMGHRWADFDAFGSSVGVARLCMFCGVKANIICNMSDPNLRGCLNLLSEVADFGGVCIDSAAAQDMIQADTLLVVCDVNNPSHFEAPEIASNCSKIAIIDHHRRTISEGIDAENIMMSYIEPSASSACELVSEILELSMPSGTITPQEAELMLAGILLDTKQFTRNVGVRTFSAALWLRSEGADTGSAQALFKTDFADFLSEAGFEANVFIYREFIAIAKSDYESEKAKHGDAISVSTFRIAASKSADRLLNINGIRASFAISRIGKTIHISARSDGTINVQLILERLGGGGHFDGAGAQLADSDMLTAQIALKNAIDDYLESIKSENE
ncbi:MAG: hypothetical protein GX897_01190 [Clostridiales bacterium]|nr:hypothetical protein [Clostridiales bacterium]